MTVTHAQLQVQSHARVTVHEVTEAVQAQVASAGIDRGIAVVSSPHTTCSVVIQEESHDQTYYAMDFLMQDLTDVLTRLVPTCTAEGQYKHPGPKHIADAESRGEEAAWSLNVDAHLRSVLLGRSVTVPVADGQLVLGEFGRLYFADFDQVRARQRTVWVTILGDHATS
jgi:secondary thiamine-phosphate synthase enzyme